MQSVKLLTAARLRDMGIHALGPIMKIMKGVHVLTRREEDSLKPEIIPLHPMLTANSINREGPDGAEPSQSHDINVNSINDSSNNNCDIKHDTNTDTIKDDRSNNCDVKHDRSIHSVTGSGWSESFVNDLLNTEKKQKPTCINDIDEQSDKKTKDDISEKDMKTLLHSDLNVTSDSSALGVTRGKSWKKMKEEVNGKIISGRSSVREAEVPETLVGKEKQKKRQSSGLSRKSSAKGNQENKERGRQKVTGKPPVSSMKTAEEGKALFTHVINYLGR